MPKSWLGFIPMPIKGLASSDIKRRGTKLGLNTVDGHANVSFNLVAGEVIDEVIYDVIDEKINKEINEEINEELVNLSNLSGKRCIYKVPETLRCFNLNAYTPKVLSIGPIHHGNKKFKRMEDIKRRFLKSFLNRSINNKCLQDYVEIIMKREKRLRAAYLEPIEFDSHEFVKIIMLDAVFIIEFLLRICFNRLTPPSDVDVFHLNYPLQILAEVPSDLLRLENQIPFFILQDLFDPIGIEINGKKLTIAYLFHDFFTTKISFFQIKVNNIIDQVNNRIYQVKHCLDFMRILYKPSDALKKEITNDKKSTDNWVYTPTITELHQAGVKFKKLDNLFDINFDFSSGVLKLPSFTIYSDFEERIRNLMAYEQCHHPIEESYICAYAILMDDLINTQEDVQLLVKYEIIVNALGDNSKVCALFNNISEGIYSDPEKFYFAKTKNDMIKYYKNPINHWKANLKQNYFNTPWKTASVFAAVLLLLLTMTQAVTSIISLK